MTKNGFAAAPAPRGEAAEAAHMARQDAAEALAWQVDHYATDYWHGLKRGFTDFEAVEVFEAIGAMNTPQARQLRREFLGACMSGHALDGAACSRLMQAAQRLVSMACTAWAEQRVSEDEAAARRGDL